MRANEVRRISRAAPVAQYGSTPFCPLPAERGVSGHSVERQWGNPGRHQDEGPGAATDASAVAGRTLLYLSDCVGQNNCPRRHGWSSSQDASPEAWRGFTGESRCCGIYHEGKSVLRNGNTARETSFLRRNHRRNMCEVHSNSYNTARRRTIPKSAFLTCTI